MGKNKKTLVTISSLALSAAPFAGASAQIVLNCSQRLFVGKHDACGLGFITVDADGGTSVNGCLVNVTAPAPGQCVLKTGGVPVTKNVVVKFTGTSTFIKFGGSQAKVSKFMMIHTGTATSAKSFTFSPTAVSNTVTLDVGSTFNFNTGLALGSYTGTITMDASLVP